MELSLAVPAKATAAPLAVGMLAAGVVIEAATVFRGRTVTARVAVAVTPVLSVAVKVAV